MFYFGLAVGFSFAGSAVVFFGSLPALATMVSNFSADPADATVPGVRGMHLIVG